MEEYYYKEITDLSYRELINFASWLNKYKGYYPTIIGGWAVWCYTKGLGSRDIDVIFPSPIARDSILQDYFWANNFKPEGTFLEKRFVKKFKIKDKTEKIIIDACTSKDISPSNLDIHFPWRPVYEKVQLFDLQKTKIYLPLPEILLVCKIKAALDRSHEIKKAFGEQRAYLESKISKDIYDLISLIQKINLKKDMIKSLLNKTRIIYHKDLLIDELNQRKDFLKDKNFEIDKINEVF